MSWIELKLNLPLEKAEDISAYLFAQGCEGLNLTDDGISIYFSDHRWRDEIKLSIAAYIKEFVPGFALKDIQVVAVADSDWNKNWKEYFKPFYPAAGILIKPPWEDCHERQGDIVLTINPQMAFGTGHHESTQLVIHGLQKYMKSGMRVLDAGTGSGILAILADKLGAESVIGFDDDPVALKNAVENATLNNSSQNVQFVLARPEDMQQSEYDLVLANINRNILLRYAEIFQEFLAENGKLILAGVIRKDEIVMMDRFEKLGYRLVEKNTMKDWLSLVLELKAKVSEPTYSNY
ncbi:MAG: 50S ribosomal protein L11 methyltransferase [Calditrichales bacterium]|nr:MAG: 50S ribosomal protein L11 methyltransferase [Calditrichales bacterium]